jgi:NAD-dependent deacetylase
MLPQDQFARGENAAGRSDICFVVGTSAVVYPAAYIPYTAKNGGSLLVEVNIELTDISRIVDESLIGKAGEILPQLLEEVKKIKKPVSGD